MTVTASEAGRRLPRNLGPMALLLVSMVFLFAVIWGALNPPDITVVYVDAGPVTSFEVGRVDAYPEYEFYVVGLENGRLRALDGRIDESDCSVNWLPNDPRGRDYNPLGRDGVFEDPCTGATWSAIGNAISVADEPMRTPQIDFRRGEDGVNHAFIEVINPRTDQ